MNAQIKLSDCMSVMHAKHSTSLVRPVESKQKLRAEIESHTAEYLKKGGVVQFCEIHVDSPRRLTLSCTR